MAQWLPHGVSPFYGDPSFNYFGAYMRPYEGCVRNFRPAIPAEVVDGEIRLVEDHHDRPAKRRAA